MTPVDEQGVREWLVGELGVSRETLERLDRFVAMLHEESDRQNLVARSTLERIWDRHIRDSAQLLSIADTDLRDGKWVDLGSGPGLPGVVLALIGRMKIDLVEVRTKRVAFLDKVVTDLGLSGSVTVAGAKLERLPSKPFDVITARAFTALPNLFRLARRFSHAKTQWILPKGRSAEEELEQARRTWQGDFALMPSLTDAESLIVIARNVRPRRRS